MLNETKKLAILGSTGSIGTQTLHIVKNNPHLFKVFLLSAHSNYMLLFEQAKEFTPKHVVINTSRRQASFTSCGKKWTFAHSRPN